MIDISKIKSGDTVTVQFNKKAKCVDFGGVLIEIFGIGMWVGPKHITSHTPAPRAMKIGDKVKTTCERGTVAAIAGDNVWVKLDENDYCTFSRDMLKFDE